MEIICNGIDHKQCSLKQRGQFAFSVDRQKQILCRLKHTIGISEAIILVTCNRTEIYLFASEEVDPQNCIADILNETTGISQQQWLANSRVLIGENAIRHLFSVAGGLESQMVGETQIISQVKFAYTLSVEQKMSGFLFHRLFHNAFSLAKKIHHKTGISQGAVSISMAAVELAKTKLNLSQSSAIIVGAGENARLLAFTLVRAGIKELIIANRTANPAIRLVSRLGIGKAISLEMLPESIGEVDLLISSTSAQEAVITKQHLSFLCANRKPITMIDIAVPRDIDAEVGEHRCVDLYNIDDLNCRIETSVEKRKQFIPQATEIVDSFTEKFKNWYSSLDAAQMISTLTESYSAIAKEQARRYCKDFGQENLAQLEAFALSLTKKILHGPIRYLRTKEGGSVTSEDLGRCDIVRKMLIDPNHISGDSKDE